MGCDGGTIPRRDELVRVKKRPEQKDKDSELSYRWRHCSITQQPLQEPIVACGLGRLYSKEAVIEGLLDRTLLPKCAEHICSIKDVKDLKLTPNPSFKVDADKGNEYIDRNTSPYICPVIGLEMNGKFRFVFLWGCGCVFSERALKEIKTSTCHKCEAAFVDDDVVILNGEEDFPRMESNMKVRQAKVKAEKKAKAEAKQREKAHKKGLQVSSNSTTEDKSDINPTPGTSQPSASNGPTPGTSQPSASNGSASKPTASSSVSYEKNGKVDYPQKISKLVSASSSKLTTDATKVHFKCNGEKRSATEKLNDPAFKKAKGSYSVASDPSNSEVFKSLFTSHKSHTKQDRAHWVTYNPFYN